MIGCEGSKLGLNNLDNWILSPALLGHWQLDQKQRLFLIGISSLQQDY